MRSERGSATLIVLALIGLIGALLIANGRAMHQLYRELNRIDKSQQQHWQQGANGQSPRH